MLQRKIGAELSNLFNQISLLVRRPLTALVLGSALWVGCGGPVGGTASNGDGAQNADAMATADTAGVAADVAGPAMDQLDRQALLAIAEVRGLIAQYGPKVWPGFAVAHVPVYLVVRDAKQKSLRGYLIAPGVAPTGAAVALPELATAVYREDHKIKLIDYWESYVTDADIYGNSSLIIAADAAQLAAPDTFRQLLVTAYFERYRLLEDKWDPVGPCSDILYAKIPEVIALLFLENALLHEAILSDDAKIIQSRLQEWYLARTAAVALYSMIDMKTRYRELNAGTGVYVANRLQLAAGVGAEPALFANYAQQLDLAVAAPIADFHSVEFGAGWTGAVLLELSRKLKWDVAPYFHKAKTMADIVPLLLGEPKPDALAAAKARYDWAYFLKRGADIVKCAEEQCTSAP